jgi:flagellum-specific ATP synthase
VFAKLPQLVERAGNGDKGGGSITAFYTVLAEGDDQNDPIADAARAILDGHIVLSRRLADAGHYPAIDIEASISRAMNDITRPGHQEAARSFKHLYSLYQQNRDLISVGAYEQGSDPQIDMAIAAMPSLNGFLRQSMRTPVNLQQSLQELESLFPEEPESEPDMELPVPR